MLEVLLFKFHCNIFIGVRIIKEMPGSVASGTHCIIRMNKSSRKGWVGRVACMGGVHVPAYRFLMDKFNVRNYR